MAILTVFENADFGGRQAAFNTLTELPQSFSQFGISSFIKETAAWIFFHADDGQILAVFGPQRIPRMDMQRIDTGFLADLLGDRTRDWNDCIVRISAPGRAPDQGEAVTIIGARQAGF